MSARHFRLVAIAALLTFPLQATGTQDPEPPAAESPAVSLDGARVAFISNVGLDTDVWMMNRDGSGLNLVLPWPGSPEQHPDWSPNGTRLALASMRMSLDFEIWSVAADGSNPLRLTISAGFDGEPRWSPDGTRIAFTSMRAGKLDVWIMDADGESPTQLTGELALQASDPAWSPAGDQIVFTGCDPICSLYTIGVDGSALFQLTDAAGEDWDSDWSNRGIVFVSMRGPQTLWVVQPDGSGLAIFSDSADATFEPRWDPGSTGTFVSNLNEDGSSSINLVLPGAAPQSELVRFDEFVAPATCGNAVIDPGEDCDDGNRLSCDTCSAICVAEVGLTCGDGIPVPECGEECDDGNSTDGDGCSSSCQFDIVPEPSRMLLQLCALGAIVSTRRLLWGTRRQRSECSGVGRTRLHREGPEPFR